MTTAAITSSRHKDTALLHTEQKPETNAPSSSAASLSQEEMLETNSMKKEMNANAEALHRNRVEKPANIEKNIKANNFRRQDLPIKLEGIPIWHHLIKNGLVPRSHSNDDPAFYHVGNFYIGHSGNIAVIDANDGKELLNLKDQNHPISGLVKKDNYLISCSWDGNLKVWDIDHLNEGQEIKEIERSKGKMFCYNCLILEGDRLFLSGIANRLDAPFEIQEIDLEKGTTHAIAVCRHQALCLAAQDNLLVAGLHNTCIEVWDLSSKKLLRTLTGKTQPCSLFIDGKKLFVGGSHGDITIWDIESGIELSRICPTPFEDIKIKSICMQNGKLYCLKDTHPNKAFVLDFNFHAVSSYSPQLLEENLTILGKISENAALAKTLHSDFQKQLAFHSMLSTRSLTFTKNAILRVQTMVLFELLLNRLHSKDQEKVSEILDQIVSLDPSNTTVDWRELFLRVNSNPSTSLKEKENAVLNYKKVKEDDWVRQDFLIDFEKGSNQKLGYEFSQLKAHGILTFDDLNALGVCNAPALPHLVELEEGNDKKKEQIYGAFKKISEVAQKRFVDTAFGKGPATTTWDLFKRQFEVDLIIIGGKCQSPQILPQEYKYFIQTVNNRINQYNTLDCMDQFMRLKTYIDQEGIAAKWKALNYQGIFSLAEFAKKNPGVNLWAMGEKNGN